MSYWFGFEHYLIRGHISKNTALHPIASCSPRLLDVPGAYNVNCSSGCFRPDWFCPGAISFRPDALSAPWCSLPSNHTPSAKPLLTAVPEAPVRLPTPKAFRLRIVFSQMRPVPAHDTLSPSEPLPNPPVPYPFSPLSSRGFPTPLFVAHYPHIVRIHRMFSICAGRSMYSPYALLLFLFSPSTLYILLVHWMFLPSTKCFAIRWNFLSSAKCYTGRLASLSTLWAIACQTA